MLENEPYGDVGNGGKTQQEQQQHLSDVERQVLKGMAVSAANNAASTASTAASAISSATAKHKAPKTDDVESKKKKTKLRRRRFSRSWFRSFFAKTKNKESDEVKKNV